VEHRDDIQGLRAVAVLLVVLAHSGLRFVSGGFIGVDVFFVLSGFLITGVLLSGAAKRGYVSLTDFYARRARRILPAAVLTLVVTDVAAHNLLNFVRARQAVSDSIWASAFGANIHFAQQGGDYFAQGQPPSPLQHFWTLAVEEQFYLVWPAVLSVVLFGAVGRFRALRPRRVARSAHVQLLVVVIAAAVASLVWSVHSTRASPATAYFSTPARAWELALGVVLAICVARLERLPVLVGVALGWLGLVGIVAAAVLFSGSTPFPGYAALVPTLATAFVIAAGVRKHGSRLGVGRVLAVAPLRYVGDRSYAFYLWHWPVLVIAIAYAGHELSVGVKLMLLVGAFLLSMISYRFFENPIRRMRWRGRAGVVLWPASAAVVLAVAAVTLASLGKTAGRVDAAAAAVRPAALFDPAVQTISARASSGALPAVVAAVRAAERGAPLPSALTPSVDDLNGDFYAFPDGCSPAVGATKSRICRLGEPTSRKTIVVFGDSHAAMWMPTILAIAQRDDWAVIPLVKVRCIPRSWSGSDECGVWYRWATRRAQALRPEVTLIIGSRSATYDPTAAIKPVEALSRSMKTASASVIVVGDAPNQTREPVDCLLARRATMKTCSATSTPAQLRTEAAIVSYARKNGVGFMNTRPWFCARPQQSASGYLCPLVVNQTITSRDRGHITRTYGLELVSSFRNAFRRELFR
jgi:peptidoglycan/LPS O-acetylase OafA/YrhL